jgi:hypothetical protein
MIKKCFILRMIIITETEKDFKMMILITKVIYNMEEKRIIKTIIKIIILPDITKTNKIHTMISGKNQIKIMIGSNKESKVKTGTIIIDLRIIAIRVQGITIMDLVMVTNKTITESTKIEETICSKETSRDKAIKNDMTNIKTTGTKATTIIIELSITISMIDSKGDMKMISKTRKGLEKENKKIGTNGPIIIIIITKIKRIHKPKGLITGVNLMIIRILLKITILGIKKLMLDIINNEMEF